MFSKSDYLHIKKIFFRFVRYLDIPDSAKTIYHHSQILKLGAILIFCDEWYNLHQTRMSRYVWNGILKHFTDTGLSINDIPIIVAKSEKIILNFKKEN